MSDLDPRALEAAARAIAGQHWQTAMDDATAAITTYLAVTQPVVTTTEELVELPVETVVRDRYGDICEKRNGGWIRDAPGLTDTASMAYSLPALVIWRPRD